MLLIIVVIAAIPGDLEFEYYLVQYNPFLLINFFFPHSTVPCGQCQEICRHPAICTPISPLLCVCAV